jgi:hypothetical protein
MFHKFSESEFPSHFFSVSELALFTNFLSCVERLVTDLRESKFVSLYMVHCLIFYVPVQVFKTLTV